MQVSGGYVHALTKGRRDGKGGLSSRTVHHMHRVLMQALGQAVKWELIVRNPCDDVAPPKVERASMNTYDMADTARILEAARGSRMFTPVLLALLCGLRRGEIAALRWRSVDLEAAQLSVVESAEQTRTGVRYKAPKSGRGRSVALPSTVVEELRSHRVMQVQELLKGSARPTTPLW